MPKKSLLRWLLPSLLASGLALVAALTPLCATETENHGLRILPAPGPVPIDGTTKGWDLSGGVFACGELEHLRDKDSLWIHAMYDAENLYILARWKDETPLNNPEAIGGHAFNGDCLQFRVILFPDDKERKAITWWDAWRDKQGRAVVERASPGQKDGGADNHRMPGLDNAMESGVKQAFKMDEDGKGYTQTLAIPWKQLSPSGDMPKVGEKFRFTVEPNFTAGSFGRITIKDIFAEVPGRTPDRIFTFRSYNDWGWATIEPKGNVEPRPVRTADGRTFPVSLGKDGLPGVNWDGLIQRFEWPGFKAITFDMPFDGYVSLNIVDSDGVVVRHLLNQDSRDKGSVTVQWDGLTDATYRTPGLPVKAGDYSWKAIAHPGAKLTLRGWASFSGRAPWQATPADFWLGDHGVPSAVVTDGDRLYLACNGAEGGKHLIATDFDGKLIWSLQNTSGGADPEFIAVDKDADGNGVVYVLQPKMPWAASRDNVMPILTRVDAKTGAYQKWPGGKNHMLIPADVFGPKENAEKAGIAADHIVAIDAKDGLIYGTTGDSALFPDEVLDWKAFLAAIKARESDPEAAKAQDELQRLPAATFTGLRVDQLKTVDRYIDGKEQKLNGEITGRIIGNLNRWIVTPGNPNTPWDTASTALANRQALEKITGAALKPFDHQVVVLDGASGALKKHWPLLGAAAIKVVDAKLAYIITGNSVVRFDLTTGRSTNFITGLRNPHALALDPQGRLLVSVGEPDHQVIVFDTKGKTGKELARIGEKGGRQIGPWQERRMLEPAGVCVDPLGKLWVMEHDRYPKRVSVWAYESLDAKTGKLGSAIAKTEFLKEFFGPTHYGASGAAINPKDPDIMVSEGCEWRINPQGGDGKCLGTFFREEHHNFHQFATYREGKNGKLYLYTNYGKYGHGKTQIWERVAQADYRLRAEFDNTVAPSNPADPQSKATELWSDLNGDGQRQPGEVQRYEGWLNPNASNDFSMNLGPDMTLYPYDTGSKSLKKLALEGFAPGGAPLYNLAKMQALPEAFSEGYRTGYSSAIPDADNKTILINLDEKTHPAKMLWKCFDLASGKLLWTYPNPYFQVHGSHAAPAPENGLFRGAFNPMGSVNIPGVGNIWIINGNLGEWWALSSEGFYVTRLFNGNVFEWNWPAEPLPGSDMTDLPAGSGGEDFGGSITRADDGKVYVQAGKAGPWNVLLTGLEKTVHIPGQKITLDAGDIAKAMEFRELAFKASAPPSFTAPKATIAFGKDWNKDFEVVPPAKRLNFNKVTEAGVTAAAAWDDENLYLLWRVRDTTPWVNGAQDISQMYASGDTVDLQLALDPKADPKRNKAAAGDLRVSIGNFKGTPTAVLYKFVSAEKKPRAFSSGVVANWEVDYVDVIADAKIDVAVDGLNYTVKAAIPWSALGIKPTPGLALRGDLGVTHGDASGTRTRLRTYWANQDTGLVDDVVFELQPSPNKWGEIIFEDKK